MSTWNIPPEEGDIFENRILLIAYVFTDGRWVDWRDLPPEKRPNIRRRRQD